MIYEGVEYGLNMAAKMSDPMDVKIREIGVVATFNAPSLEAAQKMLNKMYPRRTVQAREVVEVTG